eukprot:1572881-Rhodomonas_salina.1
MQFNNRGKTTPRAASHTEFAEYMAFHKIPAVLDHLVSRLAEVQPVDPVQQVKHPEFSQTAILFSLNIHEPLCYAQMYEDLGDLLGVSAASPSKLSESSETEGENLDGACRLSLSGKFVSGTGEAAGTGPTAARRIRAKVEEAKRVLKVTS